MNEDFMTEDDLTEVLENEDSSLTVRGFLENEDSSLTVRGFLAKLEKFLDETLEENTRGNVFLTENGDGVSVNLVLGANFHEDSPEINQVNIIITPTNRTVLGSEGVSMDDRDYDDFDYGEEEDW